MHLLRRAAALGVAGAAYSLIEARSFRLGNRVLDVSAPLERLTVLHVSDTHMTRNTTALQHFLNTLPERIGPPPDIVLATGDLINDNSGIEPIVDSLARLEAQLGRYYVLGSHDYYQSHKPSFSKYVTGKRNIPTDRRAATDELERGLQEKGWVSLINTTEHIDSAFGVIRLAGVGDPYIHLHETGHIERNSDEVLAIALVHAPDVVSDWLLRGFDLVVAGHTHGGQVRIPGIGALVTNCDLPAGLAKGAQRIGDGWLHVSPGLGTGKFTPIRFNCPPEATLLELRGQEWLG